MLTVAYEFKTPEGKTKMMNFEVRGLDDEPRGWNRYVKNSAAAACRMPV